MLRLDEQKRILAAILVLCAGEIFYVAVHAANAAEITVITTEKPQAVQNVEAAVGDVIAIAAPGRPGTGYVWSTDHIPDLLQAMPERDSPGETAVPGGARQQVLRFTVIGRGEGELVLAHRRPWEKAKPGERQMIFFIRAK